MKEYKDGFKLKQCSSQTMATIPKEMRGTGTIPEHGSNEHWPLWRMKVGQCFDLPYTRRHELHGLIRYIIRYQKQCVMYYNQHKQFMDELIPGKTPVHRITRVR